MHMETKTTASQPSKARTVLKIDPNEEHQVLSTMSLSRRGFKVTVAGSGREAMRLVVAEPFDVIVIDFKIRDLAALDVVKDLSQRLPEVPKIFVVSSGAEEVAVRALKEGAAGFLVKTPRYNELLPAEVEAQLGRAQAHRELRNQEKALAESERNASMDQLAAYVAHEINTPLTNISLLVSGISRRTDDPEIREKLERINAQRRQAAAIITDLLSLPRHRSLDRVPHDVRQLVANAAEQAQPDRKPDVELILDSGDRPVVGTVDALQVQHVTLN